MSIAIVRRINKYLRVGASVKVLPSGFLIDRVRTRRSKGTIEYRIDHRTEHGRDWFHLLPHQELRISSAGTVIATYPGSLLYSVATEQPAATESAPHEECATTPVCPTKKED